MKKPQKKKKQIVSENKKSEPIKIPKNTFKIATTFAMIVLFVIFGIRFLPNILSSKANKEYKVLGKNDFCETLSISNTNKDIKKVVWYKNNKVINNHTFFYTITDKDQISTIFTQVQLNTGEYKVSNNEIKITTLTDYHKTNTDKYKCLNIKKTIKKKNIKPKKRKKQKAQVPTYKYYSPKKQDKKIVIVE